MNKFRLGTQVGLYIGSNSVCVVQMKGTFKGPQLVTCTEATISEATERGSREGISKSRRENTAEAITRAFRKSGIKTREVVTALPEKEVMVRYFQMPRIPKSEWETAIKFEAKRYIPFRPDEVASDFQVIEKKEEPKRMDVVFVAAKKESIKSYISLLNQAGLTVRTLEAPPFSLMRLFYSNSQVNMGEFVAIVNIDGGMATINLVKDKISHLTREVSLVFKERVTSEAADSLFENLTNEIQLSFSYYKTKAPTATINKIILCGEQIGEGWDKTLSEELKLPVEIGDPRRNIGSLTKIPSGCFIAVGLAVRGLVEPVVELNLYREKIKAREEKDILKVALVGGSIACLALVGLNLIMANQVAGPERELSKVKLGRPTSKWAVDSMTYKNLELLKGDLDKRRSVLQNLIEKRTYWTFKLNELVKLLPDGVWLTYMAFQDQGDESSGRLRKSLVIKGVVHLSNRAEEIDVINKLVSEIKRDGQLFEGFEEVKLTSLIEEKIDTFQVRRFEISCSRP